MTACHGVGVKPPTSYFGWSVSSISLQPHWSDRFLWFPSVSCKCSKL